jgi:hypothetical protein
MACSSQDKAFNRLIDQKKYFFNQIENLKKTNNVVVPPSDCKHLLISESASDDAKKLAQLVDELVYINRSIRFKKITSENKQFRDEELEDNISLLNYNINLINRCSVQKELMALQNEAPLKIRDTLKDLKSIANDGFKTIFNYYYNKNDLSKYDEKLLYAIYKAYVLNTPKKFCNNKRCLFLDNPHNASFYHWFRHNSHTQKKLPLLHIDSHADMRTVPIIIHDDIWGEISVKDFSRLAQIVYNSNQRSNNKAIEFIQDKIALDDKTKTKLLVYVSYLTKDELYQDIIRTIQKILPANEYEALNKIKKKLLGIVNTDSPMIKQKILTFIQGETESKKQFQDIVKLVNGFHTSDYHTLIDEILKKMAHSIAHPVMASLATDITDTVTYVHPAWYKRYKRSRIRNKKLKYTNAMLSSILFQDFGHGYVVTMNESDKDAHQLFGQGDTPFWIWEKDKFKFFNNIQFAVTNLYKSNFTEQLSNKYKKGYILGVDIDSIATNGEDEKGPLRPKSFHRTSSNKSISIDQTEFKAVKNRLNHFIKLMRGLKEKGYIPSIISFADSTNSYPIFYGHNELHLSGGDFTPPALVFLLRYKLSNEVRKIFEIHP